MAPFRSRAQILLRRAFAAQPHSLLGWTPRLLIFDPLTHAPWLSSRAIPVSLMAALSGRA